MPSCEFAYNASEIENLFQCIKILTNGKPVPSEYGRRSKTAHIIKRRSRWALSYRLSALASERDLYPISFVVSSCCLCKRTQPFRTLQAPVLSVICLPKEAPE